MFRKKPNYIDPLRNPWWVLWRENKSVRSAVWKEVCKNWLPLVRRQLRENENKGQRPSLQKELRAVVPLHRTQIYKLLTGQHPTDIVTMQCICSFLGVSISDFFPEPKTWFADITVGLCNGKVDYKEAQLYISYFLAYPKASNPELDEQAISTLTTDALLESDVREAIKHVADCLKRQFGGGSSV